MKSVKIIAGISWAVICLVLIVIFFPGFNSFSASAAKLPFMKINPNYSGGSVTKEIVSEGCTLQIRKPVFDGLLGERKKGFVQLDWKGNVPERINDTIDYNLDGVPDFVVLIERKTAETELFPLNSEIIKAGISTSTSYGWAMRAELKKNLLKKN